MGNKSGCTRIPEGGSKFQSSCSLQPMENPCSAEQVHPEGLQLLGRTHAEVGKKCEGKEVEERTCYALLTTSIFHPT